MNCLKFSSDSSSSSSSSSLWEPEDEESSESEEELPLEAPPLSFSFCFMDFVSFYSDALSSTFYLFYFDSFSGTSWSGLVALCGRGDPTESLEPDDLVSKRTSCLLLGEVAAA